MQKHQLYMQRCLDLALNGSGTTSPNPMVGCVIVHNDNIIAQGWHHKAGEAHAEVNAINAVEDKSLLANCTLYVSLEPCSHFGKTPPCCDLILKYKIPNVIIGCLDPNPEVAGKGVEKLKKAGVEVEEGVLKTRCENLNKKFFTYHQQKRPFITLKWAKTKDGFIDKLRDEKEKGQFVISGPQSKVFVHKLRTEHDAILIGPGTAFNDDPRLNARWYEGKSPIRIVLDRFAKLPDFLVLFSDDSETWHFSTKGYNRIGNKRKVVLPEKNFLNEVLDYCFAQGIQSILVEGGAVIFTAFIKTHLWDEVVEIKSSKSIGAGLPAPKINAHVINREYIGGDEITIYKNVVPAV